MSGIAVRCVGLFKRYGNVQAAEAFDLEVPRGAVLALVGPSGGGKTTILRLIAGFETPDAGTVELNGRMVAGPGVHVPPEKRQAGMVFQDYALFPHLTVAENVAFGLAKNQEREARTGEALALVGLTGLEARRPHQLSGGQQQRVALARALAPGPHVLLLDEPFSNLHASLRLQVRQEVKDILRESDTTAVFVTHDQEEALFMGDMVAVQHQGRVEQIDSPERVFHAPTTRFVARFMGMADFLPAVHSGGWLHTALGTVPAPEWVSEQAEVEMMVRPHDLLLEPSETGSGRITKREFQGAFYMYTVELESGVVVHCLSSHAERHAEGTRVAVRIQPGHPPVCFANGEALA